MACTGRIRRKMFLGMVLVLGIMAVLLTGTLKGLEGYRSAMRVVESKVAELEKAVAFKDSISRLRNLPVDGRLGMNLKEAIDTDVRVKLNDYAIALHETIDKKRVEDGAFVGLGQLKACEKYLGSFDAALKADREPIAGLTTTGPELLDVLGEGRHVGKLVKNLKIAADDLIAILNGEIRTRIQYSKKEQHTSLVILVSSSGAAILCMAGMMSWFYRSVVRPIRVLEQGVTRVAKGDFEHRIDIRSGDEIQSFAMAFNDMAGKLHDMYGDLARQVNERSRQLVRSERLAGVGFLAAGVAHEINNPLASIAFCSEALESRIDELFTDKSHGRPAAAQDRDIVNKYLKMILEEAFRCKEITQKLLAFSRGGDRKRERTDISEIIQGVLDMVQHVPNSKGKTILFESKASIEAWVNGQEVKQVLLNLVVNALDSMDEGGTLTIRGSMRGDRAELAFTDTGCGMSEDILENIFEPFFTRSRTGKGTGLGLSISHRIIAEHGGEIEATSAGLDKGSTFIVRLPTQPAAGATNEEGDESVDAAEEFLKLNARQQRRAA